MSETPPPHGPEQRPEQEPDTPLAEAAQRPADATDDPAAMTTAPTGAFAPAAPPPQQGVPGWYYGMPPAARGGRWRSLTSSAFWRSRTAFAIGGLIVGCALTLGGLALADGGHHRFDHRAMAGFDRRGDHGPQSGFGPGDRFGANARPGAGARGGENANLPNGGARVGPGNGSAAFQRVQGTVTAIRSDSITVSTGNGNLTYDISSGTAVSGTASSVSQLKAGERVTIFATSNGSAAATVARIVAG